MPIHKYCGRKLVCMVTKPSSNNRDLKESRNSPCESNRPCKRLCKEVQHLILRQGGTEPNQNKGKKEEAVQDIRWSLKEEYRKRNSKLTQTPTWTDPPTHTLLGKTPPPLPRQTPFTQADTPPGRHHLLHIRRPLQRTVSILLECILVGQEFID